MGCCNCYNKCMRVKCCIYTNLVLNILMNIYILSILLLITYDISILNFIQALYLILSILLAIALLLYCFYKFFMIILGRYLELNSLQKLWKMVYYPSYILIGIGALYDLIIVTPKLGAAWLILYFFSFLFICFIFIALSIFDYFGIKNQIEIAKNKRKKNPLYEEQELKDVNKTNEKIN